MKIRLKDARVGRNPSTTVMKIGMVMINPCAMRVCMMR